MNEPAAAKRRRLRPPARLSVRALMGLSLLISGMLGWVVNRARVQRDAVAAIKRAGGSIAYSWEWSNGQPIFPRPQPPGPDWVRRKLGPDFIDTVTYVSLTGAQCDDELMRAACRLAWLEDLSVVNTQVTDDGADDLRRLKNLRYVDLRMNRITSRPLRHLGEMSELRELKLAKIPLRDEDLSFLRGLTKLERLMLPSPDLTDAWLVYIADLANLSVLELYDMAVTTEGLRHLRGLSNLKVLRLHGTRVTSLDPLRPLSKIESLCLAYTSIDDPALATLQDWPRLYSLDLRRTNVTDAGMITLSGLTALRMLILSQTEITDAGVAMVTKVNPQVKVRR